MKLTQNKKKYNEFTLTAKLTAGKILAIKHALEEHASPVSFDVLNELNEAITKGITHDMFGIKLPNR